MPNTFYHDACIVDARMTPFPVEVEDKSPLAVDGLHFYEAKDESKGKLELPHSIMNDNVAINYRTIYNGYPIF